MGDDTHQRSSKGVIDHHRFRDSGGATSVQDKIRIVLGLFEGLLVRITTGRLCHIKQMMKLWYYHMLERRIFVHNVMHKHPVGGQQNCAAGLPHE